MSITKNPDSFSSYHPLINFLYFSLVLVFSMVFMHPVCLVISLGSAVGYSICLKGRRAVRFSLLYMLPLLLLTALINPIFNHQGETILAALPYGGSLTLEALVYGLAAATMLVSVISWFSCCNAVIGSDKFIYLFGRIIPAMSLVLSMTLGFIPKFKARIQAVSQAQLCLGRDASEGSVFQRAKKGITILSIMVSWSLESAIETADSMKSRGYGLPGRSAFSIYRFDSRDRTALCWLLFCGGYIITGWTVGGLSFRYFPTISGGAASPLNISFFLVYLALCLTPLILNAVEDIKWTHLQSEI